MQDRKALLAAFKHLCFAPSSTLQVDAAWNGIQQLVERVDDLALDAPFAPKYIKELITVMQGEDKSALPEGFTNSTVLTAFMK